MLPSSVTRDPTGEYVLNGTLSNKLGREGSLAILFHDSRSEGELQVPKGPSRTHIERNNRYKLAAMKLVTPSKEHLEKHYEDLSDKPFYKGLVTCKFWIQDFAIITHLGVITIPRYAERAHLRHGLGRALCCQDRPRYERSGLYWHVEPGELIHDDRYIGCNQPTRVCYRHHSW